MSLRLPLVAVALALLAPAVHAEPLSSGTVKLTLKLPPEDGGTGFTAPSAVYLARYFNFARCMCDTDTTTKEYEIEYTWDGMAPSPVPSQELHPWSGEGCDADMTSVRDGQCTAHDIFTPASISTIKRVDYDAQALMSHPADTEACPDVTRSVQHWLVTQTGDTWDETPRFALANAIVADMKAPPLPTTLTLTPRESGITLEWEALSDTTDVKYFQALCTKADGSRAHDSATNAAQYETPTSMCGASHAYAIANATLTNPGPEPTADLPAPLAALDPTYVCGEASGTARAITLDDLDNGTAYRVVLVAVDNSRNLAAIGIDQPITPQQVIDFWEELNNEDPYIQGGLCIASVDGRGDLGGALVVALAIGAVIRRRRRRSRRLARLAALALVLAPAVASAQASYSPYWQDDADEELGMSEPTWTMGLRLGPYVPSIDAKFDSSPGPYARTFLNDSVMFAVDVHRVWPLLRGQLGVGVTVGYYSNSTQAFQDGTTPATPDRPRAKDNLTRLSIVPTAVTAIYRATIFDDEFGVPLVPYLRGGVAYDVWWIKNPADELSHHMSCPTCDDRALGGSIGVVGAVGLAVRAERIDPDAAMSMQNSGLEHAGFFAELEMGWIDGFGNDKKLSVGDTTWFGGVSFEF